MARFMLGSLQGSSGVVDLTIDRTNEKLHYTRASWNPRERYGATRTENLWTRSRFQGLGDSTSDANCPDTIQFTPIRYAGVLPWTWKGGGKWSQYYKIQGITKDSGGSVLANCQLDAFRTSTDEKVYSTTSDANGNYLVYTPYTDAHYIVAYKAGPPDVTGATVNTLTGT